MRAIAGFLVGHGLWTLSSVALFRVSGHASHVAAPAWFIVVAAVYGVLFAIAGGFVAAWIGGYGSGFSVAVAIFIVSMLSALADAVHPHWSQIIALVFLCPAAVLGAKLRMRLR